MPPCRAELWRTLGQPDGEKRLAVLTYGNLTLHTVFAQFDVSKAQASVDGDRVRTTIHRMLLPHGAAFTTDA